MRDSKLKRYGFHNVGISGKRVKFSFFKIPSFRMFFFSFVARNNEITPTVRFEKILNYRNNSFKTVLVYPLKT